MTSPIRPYAATAETLVERGHSPIPLVGKRPVITAWQHHCEAPMPLAERLRYAGSPLAYNVGVGCGYNGLSCIDIDTEDPEPRAALRRVLPASNVGKQGLRGLTLIYQDPTVTIRPRKFAGQGGMLVEILGPGNQTVLPPSIHPDTGLPYAWLGPRTLLNTTVDELPVLPADIGERLEDALRPWLKRAAAPQAPRPTLAPRPLQPDEALKQERYCHAILRERTAELAGMGANSGRNQAVFHLVCRVGRWVHAGILPREELEAAVISACTSNGLLKEDGQRAILATVGSALERTRNDGLPDLSARQERTA